MENNQITLFYVNLRSVFLLILRNFDAHMILRKKKHLETMQTIKNKNYFTCNIWLLKSLK